MQTLNFKAKLLQNGTMNAAYIEVSYDIKALFGKGRLLVNATFDGVAYQGQVVKMGTPCYIIGVPQNIRKQIGKSFGEEVQVTLAERQKEEPEFRTIAEYIEAQEESHQNDLRLIYHWLKETLGDAEEKIASFCYEKALEEEGKK